MTEIYSAQDYPLRIELGTKRRLVIDLERKVEHLKKKEQAYNIDKKRVEKLLKLFKQSKSIFETIQFIEGNESIEQILKELNAND